MKTKTLLSNIGIIIMSLGVVLGSLAGEAFCLPELDQIDAGSVSISYPDASTMKIEALDNKAIVNYKSFNLAQNESMIVSLPQSNSEILNRVTGNTASSILGNITSNGIFILINPNGINIGASAIINAASFIASTRDITNANFLNSKYIFEKMSKEQMDTLLLNKGNINVSRGGFAALIGGAIENQGMIIANLGTIAMAAGDMVTLDISDNNLISVAIDRETADTIYDANGNPVTDQLKNIGTLKADGGVVLLKAESVTDIFDKAINLEGYVQANKMEEKDGLIKILTTKNVLVNATVAASKVEIGKVGEAIPANVNLNSGSIVAEKTVTVLANNNIKSNINITAGGDIRLYADYDGDGFGEFSQSAGLIYAQGSANIYIDGSGSMGLGTIKTDLGSIYIGTQRAPVSIVAGSNTEIYANYVKFVAENFIVNSTAITTEIYKNTGDLALTSAILDNGMVTLEGENGLQVKYLKANNLTLHSDNAVNTSPGVIIPGNQVKVIAKQFGTRQVPLNIAANQTYIQRLGGEINIAESVGLGSTVMLRGPPEADFGALIYARTSDLVLEASKVSLVGSEAINLYGNITFSSLEIIGRDKEVYFEAGKTYVIKGLFKVQGEYGHLARLLSQEEGKQWYIDPQGERDLLFMAVQDSYNINPVEIVAIKSNNETNNFNWDPTTTWIGAGADNNWSTGGNWDTGVAPPVANDVVFDGNTGVYVNANKDSTIDSGFNAQNTVKSLTVNGYTGTITVGTNFTAAVSMTLSTGNFSASSYRITTETLSITTVGTFNAGTSNFRILPRNASSTGSITANGYTFYDITMGTAGGATADTTITIGAGTINIGNVMLLVANNNYNSTIDASVNNPTINITEDLIADRPGAGVITLKAGSGTWTVTGNINFGMDTLTNMTLTAGTSTFVLNSSSTSTALYSYGQSFYNLQLNNASGTWNMQDALSVSNTLTFTQGKLNVGSGSYSVTAKSIAYTAGEIVAASGDITIVSTDGSSAFSLPKITGVSGGAINIGQTIAPNAIILNDNVTTAAANIAITTSGTITLAAAKTISTTGASGAISLTSEGSSTLGGGITAIGNLTLSKNAAAASYSAGGVTLTAGGTLTINTGVTLTAASGNLDVVANAISASAATGITTTTYGSITLNSTGTVGAFSLPAITGASDTTADRSTITIGTTAPSSITLNGSVSATKANIAMTSAGVITQAAGTTISTTTSGGITLTSEGDSTLRSVTSAGTLRFSKYTSAATYSVVASGATTVSAGDTLTIDSSATLNISNASNMTLTLTAGAGKWVNNGWFGLLGAETVNNFPTTSMGNIYYNGAATITGLILGYNYTNNLEFASPGVSSYTLQSPLTVSGNLEINGASLTLNTGGNAVTVTGTLIFTTGTITATSNNVNITANAISYTAGSITTTISGNITLNALVADTGTFDLPAITCAGTVTIGNLTDPLNISLRGLNSTGDFDIDINGELGFASGSNNITSGNVTIVANTISVNTGTLTTTTLGNINLTITQGSTIHNITSAGAVTLNSSAGAVTYNLGADGDAGYTITVPGVFTIGGNVQLMLWGTGGTIINTGGSFTNNGTLNLVGSETLTDLINDSTTTTAKVVYSSGTGGTYTGLIAGNNYYDLTFGGGEPSGATYKLNNNSLVVNGTLRIISDTTGTALTTDNYNFTAANFNQSGGTFNAGASTVTISGNFSRTGGTFNAGTSTFTFNKSSGTQTLTSGGVSFNKLTHSGAGTLQLADALDVNGNFTNSAGTFDANGKNQNFAGDFNKSGGTYTTGGTVTFDGAGISIISGENIFNNFFCNTAGKEIQFESGKTQTFTGTMRITGTSASYIKLRSTADNSQWSINVAQVTTHDLDYLDVKDSNGLPKAWIANYKDNGNNQGWQLAASEDQIDNATNVEPSPPPDTGTTPSDSTETDSNIATIEGEEPVSDKDQDTSEDAADEEQGDGAESEESESNGQTGQTAQGRRENLAAAALIMDNTVKSIRNRETPARSIAFVFKGAVAMGNTLIPAGMGGSTEGLAGDKVETKLFKPAPEQLEKFTQSETFKDTKILPAKIESKVIDQDRKPVIESADKNKPKENLLDNYDKGRSNRMEDSLDRAMDKDKIGKSISL